MTIRIACDFEEPSGCYETRIFSPQGKDKSVLDFTRCAGRNNPRELQRSSMSIEEQEETNVAPEERNTKRLRMANTYSQIYIQLVFSVKNRQSLIRQSFKIELYKYIAGIIRNQNQKLLAIDGTSDHIHILINMKPNVALSDLVREIKSDSSRFINSKNWIAGKFNWQEGFGAFSYSYSQLDSVIRYIQNQQQHHAKKSFREEYLQLLKRFNVDYRKEKKSDNIKEKIKNTKT